ncbi:hypothetical protein DRF62_00290 [Chryseobacterium piscium]|uniref:RadC-like JAB domain-containing protein n=1 Tax=Chryseobacterium piscium TaxID=333702 RepID=A0A3D9BV67_9FLAO|nr:hypothetical protein [Chryseobacterium piscium]REC57435.1 hypothetical protein DRF62_00290 [Chryseobacterium piscium]
MPHEYLRVAFLSTICAKLYSTILNQCIIFIVDHSGPGSEIRSALAKAVDITSDLAPLEILQYEKYIFNLPIGWAGIITKNGEIITNITSKSRKAVDISGKYGVKLISAIVTHNHLRGNSLSTSDIRRFMFQGLKELCAVAGTNGSVFVLPPLPHDSIVWLF